MVVPAIRIATLVSISPTLAKISAHIPGMWYPFEKRSKRAPRGRALEVGVGNPVHDTRSVGNRGKRRTLPVVRWLQLGTVATGIGIAMLAAPAAASADDGGGSSTASSSHSSASGGSTARDTASVERHTTTAGSGRRGAGSLAPSARTTSASAQATSVRTRRAAAGTPRITATATTPIPAAPATGALTTTADRIGGSQALQSISDALQQALASAANKLANEPPTPINRLLREGVYLIQRTLFPASVGVITTPIKVPLYFQTIDNAGTQKLGIYVSIGYGAPPQLFEFDTGAGGFYAAYASVGPAPSPWWGSNVTTTTQQVQDSYDSGLSYSGYAAIGTVSLYTVGSSTPLVTSGQVTVGQIDTITNKDGQQVWSPIGSVAPPIDNAFYGDFGMAPTYQANGIDQVIAQLTFGRGVKAGYLVHVDPDTGEAWMQIGLTNNNIANSQGMYFPMLADPKASDGQTFPNSGLHFYGLQLFNATINIIDKDGTLLINTPLVGITPDTGATTTLHNTNLSPPPYAERYNSIIEGDAGGGETVSKLKKGMLFWLSGNTTGQTPVRYFQFVTTDDQNAGKVKVQNPTADDVVDPSKAESYYLNTGISLFYEYDVVYYLGTTAGNGTLGLIPQKSS